MRRIKDILLITSITILLALSSSVVVGKEKLLPAECTTGCISQFGEVLGVGLGNVPAYSNCNSGCVVFSPNKDEGTYTGIKWQCVEYARRWLLLNKGVVYGDVDIAADIWGLDFVTRVKDKAKLKMLSFANGADKRPEVGDLLIYAKAFLKTGHVAVISKVDTKSRTINVIEQNYNNTKWPAGFARTIPYVEHNNKFWLLDPYLLGWKHVTGELTKVVN